MNFKFNAISFCPVCRQFWFCLVVALVLSPGLSQGQSTAQPADINGPSEVLVAASQGAWCSALAPDESWIATGYGQYQGDVGRLKIWDLKTGQVKWEAREARGIRIVAVSPDGSIVASGNFGGEIRLRNAASGEVLKTLGDSGQFRDAGVFGGWPTARVRRISRRQGNSDLGRGNGPVAGNFGWTYRGGSFRSVLG